MDLIVRNARLSDRAADGPMDIGVCKGRIVAIERGLAAEGKTYDAEGRLLVKRFERGRVVLSLPEDAAPHAGELEASIRRWLRVSGRPEGNDLTLDLRALIAACRVAQPARGASGCSALLGLAGLALAGAWPNRVRKSD